MGWPKYFLHTYDNNWLEHPLNPWQVSRMKASVRYKHRSCIHYCTAVVLRVKLWHKPEWDDDDIEQILYRDIHGEWIECADSHDGYDTQMVTDSEAHDLALEELSYYLERFHSMSHAPEKTA